MSRKDVRQNSTVFYSWEDSPCFTSPLWTLLILVSATVFLSTKTRFSKSETLLTLFIVYTVYDSFESYAYRSKQINHNVKTWSK